MKKITLLIAVLFTCMFTAQAQQKAKPAARADAVDAKIVTLLCHKWRPTHFEAMGQRQQLEQGANGSYMWFKKDGTMESVDESGKSAGKWSYNAATKMLTVTEAGERVDQAVSKLTEKELVLTIKDKELGQIGMVLSRAD